MKKKVLLGLSIAGLMLLGACGNSEAGVDSSKESGSQKLVVSTFGLSEDIVKQDIMAPFEKEFDTKITLDIGNSSDRFTKLKSNKNAGIDVIELSQANAADGAKEGLFEPLSEDNIPNIKELTPGAKEVLDSGAGVPIAVNSIGIIYDEEKLGRPITSWDELWSDDLKGKISIPDITTTAGPLMMYVASDYAKQDIISDKGEAAFKAIEELKPNVVKTYSKSSDLANMFQSGEIEVAVVADFAVDIIQGAHEGATYVVPESGTYANYNTINVPTSSKNKELAYDFVNERISEASQKRKALSLNEGPVNSKVNLTEEEQGHKTYGDVAERAKTVDFGFVNENMASWLDQWNRIMNQ